MKAYLYRIRFVASVIAVTVLPIIFTGMVLLKAAEQALLEEKKQKLIAITQQLDYALTVDFEQLVQNAGAANASRAEQIRLINRQLQSLTDQIAEAHPGIGVGYYAARLDAIVTYGPSQEMGLHVGKTIGWNHPGRGVLLNGALDVVIGEQVRGNIMNAMVPLVRNNQVIGYAWANELMSNIDVQLAGMRQSIYAILGIGCVIAAVASGLLMHRLEVIIAEIKTGLSRLSLDLSYRIKRLAGEPGEISDAINKLAGDLQSSRSRTETIMDSMDSGVIALDQRGILTAWNESAALLIGLTREQAMGLSYECVFSENEPFVSMLSQTLVFGHTIRDAEWSLVHPVRGALILKVSTSIWKSPSDEVLGVIVVLEDRTEWKRMESRLAQAERLAVIGEWAASIAHEVRNPLTSIKAFAQIIEEDLPPEHESREYTAIIVEEVGRLNRFSDELLMFSRPSEESNVEVDLHEIILQSTRLIEPSARERGIGIRVNKGEDDLHVLASPEMMKHVFLNMLLNAVQAVPSGGWIELECTRSVDQHVLVHVTNEGEPISEEHMVKVFEPFFTTKSAGTGLGLAISQRIIQAYGGHIEVQNWERGVRFTIVLPMREERGSA